MGPPPGVGIGRTPRAGTDACTNHRHPFGKDMHMLWTIIVVIVVVLAVIGLLSILRGRSVYTPSGLSGARALGTCGSS